MELRGGRGGGNGERQRPLHGVRSVSSVRCGKARARARVGARGDGWGLTGDVGATQGGGRRAARPPRGRGRWAATPGRGPGARSSRGGKGTLAVENREPRGHVRWGRGLFGERAFGGGWRPAEGWEAAQLRPGAAFEEGAAAAPEVPPRDPALGVGGRMAERGRGPHGSAGTPPPRSGPPETPGGHMVGGSRQPSARLTAGPRGRLRELGILKSGRSLWPGT